MVFLMEKKVTKTAWSDATSQSGYAHDCFDHSSDGPAIAHKGSREVKTASDLSFIASVIGKPGG